jgi:hypothetical protein
MLCVVASHGAYAIYDPDHRHRIQAISSIICLIFRAGVQYLLCFMFMYNYYVCITLASSEGGANIEVMIFI